MSYVDFCVIKDPHLDGINNLFPNYDFDPNTLIFKAMDMVTDYAYENNVEHIIIAGDVYDHPHPSQELQAQFLKWLKKHSKLNFYIIAGNHDYSSVETISLHLSQFIATVSQEFSHIHFFIKPDLVKIEGVPFSFLPWPHCKTLQNPSVNIAHIEITGSFTDNGKKIEKGYNLDVEDGLAYIGHLHQKQFYPKKKAFYGGTLFQKNFGEKLPKGFFHVSAHYKAGSLTCKHEYHEVVPPFELVNMKIEEYADFKKIKKPDPKKIRQYRLMIKAGVELPIGLREDFPNIVTIQGSLNNKEIKLAENSEYQADAVDTSFDLLDGLGEFLVNEGLTPKELKVAHKIASRYLGG